MKNKVESRKVWIALQVFAFDSAEFLGVAESMEAAKKVAGSGRTWEDNPNGKESTANVTEYEWFTVFETDVIS